MVHARGADEQLLPGWVSTLCSFPRLPVIFTDMTLAVERLSRRRT